IAARKARAHGQLTVEERAAVMGPYHSRAARAHLANLLYGLRVEAPFFARLEVRLPELAQVRTLLLFGAEDNNYKSGAAERFALLLPNHTVRALRGAAHFLTEDVPQAYTDELREWLT